MASSSGIKKLGPYFSMPGMRGLRLLGWQLDLVDHRIRKPLFSERYGKDNNRRKFRKHFHEHWCLTLIKMESYHPGALHLITAILTDPPEHHDWSPKKWRKIQLRLKACLAILLRRYKGGYPFEACGLNVYSLDVWYSETWGPASWEYGGVCWNQIDVCCGWLRFHVHFNENSSV